MKPKLHLKSISDRLLSPKLGSLDLDCSSCVSCVALQPRRKGNVNGSKTSDTR